MENSVKAHQTIKYRTGMWSWVIAQLVQHLPGKCKSLSSNHHTVKKNVELLYELVISLLGIYPKEIKSVS
jgi:hypothetical protein